MAIPKFEDDLRIISKLGDNPGTDNGYTTQEFKEAFDKAPLLIQKFINEVLIPAANASSSHEEGLSMKGPINMNGQPISGLNMPTANDQVANMGFVNQQVKKAAPRNLLDNSDFRNPVNQRGVTTFTGADSIIRGYVALDRWLFYGTDTTFAVTADGISAVNGGAATCGIAQRVEPGVIKTGKKYTLAFKGIVTGTVYLSYGINATTNTESQLVETGVDKIHAFTFTAGDSTANGMYNIRIRSNAEPSTMDVEWITLYEGEYTAETLPEYQPKGYGAELAECQRYFFATKPATTFSGYFSNASKDLILGPVFELLKMRTVPTVIINGVVVVRTPSGYSTAEGFTTSNGGDASLLSSFAMHYDTSFKLVFNSTATSTNNTLGSAVFKNPVYFSADL